MATKVPKLLGGALGGLSTLSKYAGALALALAPRSCSQTDIRACPRSSLNLVDLFLLSSLALARTVALVRLGWSAPLSTIGTPSPDRILTLSLALLLPLPV